MHVLSEQLCANPVIAAVKNEKALTMALASDCKVVFVLASTLLNLPGYVSQLHAAGKLAVVHLDLVEGLSTREIAVDVLAAGCQPDGIISTHPAIIRRARACGLLTIQRAFLLDSLSLTSLYPQLEQGKPDFVEILPGIMPSILTEICTHTTVPLIAGGLIRYKSDVLAAIQAGASAVSSSSPEVWRM